jgi:transposase
MGHHGGGLVIGLIGNASVKVFLACGATDLRKSFDGLYGMVEGQLKEDPCSGAIFVFCNRTHTRLKILYFDGSGLWVCAKRLEQGRFGWPKTVSPESKIALSQEQLTMLLGGYELDQMRAKKWWRKKM